MTGTDTVPEPDPAHFTKAVTELGEKRPVVTTQAIFNDRGIKILEKGVAVNAGLYERLMAHKLTVPLQHSVASTQTVTGAILRAQAELALSDIALLGRVAADSATRALLLDALEKLPLPYAMAFQLTLAFEVRPELFRHAIHTALLAAWLTSGRLVTRFDVTQAAAAGLLHDIGMLHLDPVLLQSDGVIGRDQRRQLYSHPLVSTALIERHHEYPRELLRAVREHHEFLNGSGYPKNLQGAAISPLGRVLSLCELVSATLSPQRAAPELRLWVMLRMNKHCYDPELVERVMGMLRPHDPDQTTGLTLLPDAVQRLLEIDATLCRWPTDLTQRAELTPGRRAGMAAVAEQAAQLRRTLATTGAAPQQLEQLGDAPLDEVLGLELSLLTQEAAWQLRALVRQCRRRWRLQTGETFPAALQEWLDQADALIAAIYRSGAPLSAQP